MILHTLNKAPSNNALDHQLYEAIDANDSVLLIEDGAYQLLSADFLVAEGHWSLVAKNIYALRPDVEARGISANIERVDLVDYPQFVALSAKHQNVISWY